MVDLRYIGKKGERMMGPLLIWSWKTPVRGANLNGLVSAGIMKWWNIGVEKMEFGKARVY